MNVITLHTGRSMPVLGLGTWSRSAAHGEVRSAIKHALSVGYRHIDCAFIYGNESEIGEALGESFSEGLVRRDQVFVTSKLWLTHLSRGRARKCLAQSLKSLKLDYLDLYLIHWPMGLKEGDELLPQNPDGTLQGSDVEFLETWAAMEDFQAEGLVKSIGLSNFNSRQIKRIVDNGRVKPAVLQIESHPYFANSKLIDFCRSLDIAVTAYSPLGSPSNDLPRPDAPSLLDHPALKTLAEKHGKTVAQILLRFSIDRGLAVIPKSSSTTRISSNLEVFDFRLDDEDLKAIAALDRPDGRMFVVLNRAHLPEYPFKEEF